MKRTELTAILSKVDQAVSARDFIPVFACYCFDGTTVTAYDDVVAMQAPCPFNLHGAIKGKLLLPWLKASKATEVDISHQDGTDIVVKAGRSELKTTVLPTTEFIFKFPDPAGAAKIALDEATIDGLRKAMFSIGRDPSHPWRLGITVHFRKQSVAFYSTDDRTATRVLLPLTPEEGMVGRLSILPPKFCEILVNSSRDDKPKELLITEGWVEARFDSGLRLFSRTIGGAEVTNFQKVFEMAGSQELIVVDVPPGLERCLNRALAIIPFCTDNPYTALSVSEGKLNFRTESKSAGFATDSVPFEGHPDCKMKVVPDMLMKAVGTATHLGIVQGLCVVLSAEGFTYLVSQVTDD